MGTGGDSGGGGLGLGQLGGLGSGIVFTRILLLFFCLPLGFWVGTGGSGGGRGLCSHAFFLCY